MRPATGVVLVVEDDADVREAIVDELGLLGYDTYEAGDASTALDHLGDAIDVLLTDVQLPGLPGPEIVNRFRALRPDLAVVFMSGVPPEGLRSIVPGDATFLRKPFTSDELADAIRRSEDERDALG
jgi:CheY-like chemotaxis protein